MNRVGMNFRSRFARVTGALALSLGALAFGTGAQAQVQSVDPNSVIDGDLSPRGPGTQVAAPAAPPSSAPAPVSAAPVGSEAGATPEFPAPGQATTATGAPVATASTGATYHEDDLIGAAEGVFGKGAKGLAGLIQDLLKKQGEPNGYITGREAGGALVVGLRYGSGTLHHKVEGERPVYWTGPSIGFDAGANAASTFVLVYNLYDSEELFKRFPAGEGQAYLVGGFNVSYLRKGDIVLIPVRAGAGLRLGINGGYMKFSHKQNWVPF
jgi:hypothetical protein